MTITLPDTAAAAAITTIAGAIVWAIRVITNKHLAVLNEQSNMAKAIQPLVQEVLNVAKQTRDMVKSRGVEQQLVRLRRAIKRINWQAFVCDDCMGWFGETSECPDALELCRCSDPGEVQNGRSSVSSPSKTPPAGLPSVGRRSNPGRRPRPDKVEKEKV